MVVVEGFENALAVSLVGHARVVAVGAVGAYGRCRLPRTVEAITLAHDGDDPDAKPTAAQAYYRGAVRYLGQGLTLRMTAPPIGRDPNDVFQNGGPDALKKLLASAKPPPSRVPPPLSMTMRPRLTPDPLQRVK
jgi:DNA primase